MNPCLINPQMWAICIIISALAFGGGYLKGSISEKKDCELTELKAENKAYEEVKPIELKAATNLSNIGKSYVEEKKQNVAKSDAVASSFAGLRVKSNCQSLPTSAPAGSGINAAGSEERQRQSDVDFTDIEEQIRKLGLDYDNAASKINKLQETVNVYQSVCGIANP